MRLCRFWFILLLARNRPSKLAFAASSSITATTSNCCDLCLRSRVCPVASYDTSDTAARAASACCLLQQLQSCLLKCAAYFSNYMWESGLVQPVCIHPEITVRISHTRSTNSSPIYILVQINFIQDTCAYVSYK